ncbi:MAG: LLM class flavin-dependent oxidoreductase [Pseudomonadales bacterium]
MTVQSSLRFNMTGSEADPELRSLRYRAAIDMAEYADKNGFTAVNFEEHHGAANGWLPSPLTMASAAAARTERVKIGVMALLVALYDPIRLAEDIAVVDLLSRGRLTFIAGMGYRELEFRATNKPFENRGEWMDHVLDTLLKAWYDEPFDYNGIRINVTPKPYSRPHPMFLVGGMSKPAARRAARYGLPFAPPSPMPELEALYYEELAKQGKQGFVYTPPANFSCLFIDEHPESAWDELGECFLNEVEEYSSWAQKGLYRPLEMPVHTVEELKLSKLYEIITPEECIARHQADNDYNALLHPLCGGISVERGWDCIKLYKKSVLNALTD